MKIGLDISQSVYKGTGVGRFTNGLVQAICNYEQKNDWVFLFSSFRQNLDPALEKIINTRKWPIIKIKIPPKGLSALWNDLHILNIETLVGKLDWFISSDWTEPPSKCKRATVIHDLVYLRYPQTVDPLILKTQTKRLKWVAKESALIFADSQATKDDLIKLLKISEQKIIVNYPGLEITKPAKKITAKKPFILTVGKIEPRKNLGSLIEAFNKIGSPDVELLIVGPGGWDKSVKPRNNIKFTGYVSDQELANLYTSCLFFVYPSIWEGFGYPVLEAMSHGAPVATSDNSSLKEISKDSALLFDPLKVDSIANALQQLLNDQKLRQSLAQKGKLRAKDFTWKTYYAKMINSLNL